MSGCVDTEDLDDGCGLLPIRHGTVAGKCRDQCWDVDHMTATESSAVR